MNKKLDKKWSSKKRPNLLTAHDIELIFLAPPDFSGKGTKITQDLRHHEDSFLDPSVLILSAMFHVSMNKRERVGRHEESSFAYRSL